MLAEWVNARDTVDCESPSLLATCCAVTPRTMRLLRLLLIDAILLLIDAMKMFSGGYATTYQKYKIRSSSPLASCRSLFS
jgi:hypothetical protein